MAKESYVYLIKKFAKLSALTATELKRIQTSFANDGNFPDPNAALMIRFKGPMLKATADHFVALNPEVDYDGIAYSTGAVKGNIPGHKPASDPDDSAYIYAIRQYSALSDLDPTELKRVQGSYPSDNVTFLLFRKSDEPVDETTADEDVTDNPEFPVDGDSFDQGSLKGTPPGSTAALDRHLAFQRKNNAGYTIRQFQSLSELTVEEFGKIKSDFPIYLHYIARHPKKEHND